MLSAEGRLSAWILGLLPIVFAVYLLLVRPEYLKPLFTDPIGGLMLGLGVDAARRRRALAAQGRQGGGLTMDPNSCWSSGLAAVFLALAIALATIGVMTSERQQVSRSLAAVNAIRPRRPRCAASWTRRSPSG